VRHPHLLTLGNLRISSDDAVAVFDVDDDDNYGADVNDVNDLAAENKT